MEVQRVRRRDQARQNRAAVSQEIMRTARRLVTEQRFASASVEDLMAGTGMGRTAFYRYFDDRESVLLALLSEAVADLRAAIRLWSDEEAGDIRSLLDVSFAEYAPLLRAVQDLASSDDRLRAAYSSAIDLFCDAVAERIEWEQQRGRALGLDARLVAEALVLMNDRFEQVSLDKNRSREAVVNTQALIWERVLYGVVAE